MRFSLKFPGNLIYGEGSVACVGEIVAEFGSRCFVVTGHKSSIESGALDSVKQSLTRANITLLDVVNVDGEPTCDSVDHIRGLLSDTKADVVIGLGGGSPLDAAKAAAGLSVLPDLTQVYLNKKQQFTYCGIPFIAIPTTAGSGSEITQNAVLYNPITKNKSSIAHPAFQARVGIIDPILIRSLPAQVTAATAMDALTHAIESYVSTSANAITQALAAKAIRLIGGNILLAIHDGSNEAHDNLALGSMSAALAFANTGVGLAHAISHPLGAFFKIPHGVINALLLSTVLEFNKPSCQQSYNEIGRMLGDLGDNASNAIDALVTQLPIPQNLTLAGYRSGQEDAIVERVLQSRSFKRNPRFASKKDIVSVIQSCV